MSAGHARRVDRWTAGAAVWQHPRHVSAAVFLRVPDSGARRLLTTSSHDAPRGHPARGVFVPEVGGRGQNEVPMLTSTRGRRVEMSKAGMNLPLIPVPESEEGIDALRTEID